jgi:hypothetical protein
LRWRIFRSGHIPVRAQRSKYSGTSFCLSGDSSGISSAVRSRIHRSCSLAADTPEAFAARLVELARPRLAYLANQNDDWWMDRRPFFDVERQRIWIFWRRVLHSAHHRTQLTVYLRLRGKPVVSIYGPTADVTWAGASPTLR